MASRPPLSTLETAVITARHGSFSEAAIELGITHGAVSRRIAALESWLGIAVFERHGRGIRLTPDGQRFITQIEEAFRQIDLASDRWSKRDPSIIRMSVLPSFAKLWLFERLSILERAADCRIELAIEHRNLDIERGEVDVAIRYGRGRWRNVKSLQLGTEIHYPIAQGAVTDRLGETSNPEQLLRMPLIHDSDATGWRNWFKETAGLNFKPRTRDRRFEDYTLTLAAAEQGLGIALARMPLSKRYFEGSSLRRVHRANCKSLLNYYFLMRPGETRAIVFDLAKAVIAAFAEEAAAIE